jgi:hypothetical protein
MSAAEETNGPPPAFDFSSYPDDTCFHERRTGPDRRGQGPPPDRPVAPTRRKVERRRRVDPTTFEKQYSADEIEFMNAMQRFKVQTGKAFPSYGEVLGVARALGYRQAEPEPTPGEGPSILPVTAH